MSRRCVIIGGAKISRYDLISGYLRPGDFNIYCDCGLKHRQSLGAVPDLIVGDFDSYPAPAELMATGMSKTAAKCSEDKADDLQIIALPREKDDTDTVFAAKEALRRGFDDFLLIGMTGQRMDHTLANLSILLMLDSAGVKAVMADDFSLMEIVSDAPAYIDSSFEYFSLLNISGTARDITIENAKFPLSGGEITCEYQYGVSNEVLPGMTARVTVGDGRLLLVKVFHG